MNCSRSKRMVQLSIEGKIITGNDKPNINQDHLDASTSSANKENLRNCFASENQNDEVSVSPYCFSVRNYTVLDKELIPEDPLESLYYTPSDIDTWLQTQSSSSKNQQSSEKAVFPEVYNLAPEYGSLDISSHVSKDINFSLTPEKSDSESVYELRSSEELSSDSAEANECQPENRKSSVLDTVSNHKTDESSKETTTVAQNSNDRSDAKELNLETFGKKRRLNSKKWKSNILKNKVRTGQEHLTKNKKIVAKRVMKGGCSVDCRKGCRSKITDEKRTAIFEKFWRMADYNRQSAFVGSCVKRIQKKRVMVKDGNSPPRKKSSLSYTLPAVSTDRTEVCKKMFLDTLSITDMWVTTALRKMDASETGTVTPDKRGTHSNRPFVIPTILKTKVKEHINLFPRVPSHYCRARTKKETLRRV